MKVYVGSKFSRAAEVREVMDVLESHGHEIVGDWTQHTLAGVAGAELRDRLTEYAEADFDGVAGADAFVLLHDDASRGGFTELGIALGLGKLVVVIGGRVRAPHKAPIFYALEEVEHFEDSYAAAEWLQYLDTVFAAKSHDEMVEASR